MSRPLPPALSAYATDLVVAVDDAVSNYLESVRGNFPDALLHYTSKRVPLLILEGGMFMGTHFKDLNDTTEIVHLEAVARRHLKASIDTVPRQTGRMLECDTPDDAAAIAVWKAFETPFETSIAPYIISLTTQAEDIHQWNSYGQGAKGACLLLDTWQLVGLLLRRAGHNGGRIQLWPVLYEESEQQRLVETIVGTAMTKLREAFDVHADEQTQADVIAATIIQIRTALFWYGGICKHPGFRSENEWRVVIIGPPDSPREEECHRATEGVFFKEIDGKRRCFVAVNRHVIRAIQIGPLGPSPKSLALNIDKLLGVGASTGFEIFKSEIPYRRTTK